MSSDHGPAEAGHYRDDEYGRRAALKGFATCNCATHSTGCLRITVRKPDTTGTTKKVERPRTLVVSAFRRTVIPVVSGFSRTRRRSIPRSSPRRDHRNRIKNVVERMHQRSAKRIMLHPVYETGTYRVLENVARDAQRPFIIAQRVL